MASLSSKAVMRQYYLRCSLILGCYLAVIVPCIYLYPNVWSIIFCTALYLLVKLLIRITANKIIAGVLFTELDAIEFQKLMHQKRFLPPLNYRINAAIYAGDYQTVVNIATSKIKKKSSIRVKYIYLCVLAQVYFELRDFEKLQKLLTEYDNYRAKYSSKSFLNPPYSIWSYYRYFLDHDYQACKVLCKEKNLGIKPNSWDAKVKKIINDFFYAVACYESGESEEAKSFFENIILIAPRMNYASLSEKYLMAIEQGRYISFCDVNILPDINYQVYDEKTNNKIKRLKLIKIIGFFIIAVYLISNFINQITSFENKLYEAIIQRYEDAIVLDYIDLYQGEKIVDRVALILQDNRISLVEMFENISDGTIDVYSIKERVKLGKYYYEECPRANYYIGFILSKNERPDMATNSVREFTFNGDNYLFSIYFFNRK